MATITYNTAPDWRTTWFNDQVIPLIDGTLEFFKASDHGTQKAVYQTNIIIPPATTPPAYPNPIDLEAGANVGPIFFASDENYYIELRDSVGTLIQTVDNWNSPEKSDPTPKATEVDFTNYFTNGDFSQLYRRKFESSQLGTGQQVIAPREWNFIRSNTNATVTIEFIDFIPGQTDVPNNPVAFMRYECTDVGGGAETFKDIGFIIQNVRSLSGEKITLTLYARSSSTSQIGIAVHQDFGVGGSSPVTTTFETLQLTADWVKYVIKATIPTIDGKVVDDRIENKIEFLFSLPLNAVSEIDFSLLQVVRGEDELEYEYLPDRYSNARTVGIQIPPVTQILNPNSEQFVLSHDENGRLSWANWLPAGVVFPYAGVSAPNGFFIANGAYVPNWRFPRLVAAIGGIYGDDFTVASRLANVVTVTCKEIGVVTDATAGTSPFTVSVTQQGTGGLPEIFDVTTTTVDGTNAGQYLTFSAISVLGGTTDYYVWLFIDNSGVDPAVGGATEIRLEISALDTVDEIAEQLKSIMDGLFIRIPDYRGRLLRGVDDGVGRDPDAASRNNRGDGITGDNVGTIQGDEFKAHTHDVDTFDFILGTNTTLPKLEPDSLGLVPFATTSTGGAETRPINIYVNYIIKY